MTERTSVAARKTFWEKFFLLILLSGVLLIAVGCQQKAEPTYQGYAEGDFVLLAAPFAGKLEHLNVMSGSWVHKGDPLFSLDREPEQFALEGANQQVIRAESRVQDLLKGLRPTELAVLRSRQDQALTALALAQREFERRTNLYQQQAIAAEELDRARAEVRREQATVAELKAQLETAQLGSRSDTIEAAQAELEVTRAQLRQARWSAEQKNLFAPLDALVFDTLFEPGEFVPAGTPVISLLPPANIKIRFFIPEPLIGGLQIGQHVVVSYDGSAEPFTASISFISPEAEYTPPVIYSRETRTKLVFLVEARPEPMVAARLHPGQPVDVRLVAADE